MLQNSRNMLCSGVNEGEQGVKYFSYHIMQAANFAPNTVCVEGLVQNHFQNTKSLYTQV